MPFVSYSQDGPGGVGSTDGTSELVLWLQSDTGVYKDAGSTSASDGDNIQEWHDQSGYGNNATQTTTTYQTTYQDNTFNGYPVIRFDGTDDFFDDSRTYTARTVFVVFKVSSSSQSTNKLAQLWGYYGNGAHVAPEPRNNSYNKGFSFDGNATTQAKYALDGITTTSAARNSNEQQWDYDNYTLVFVEFTANKSMTRQVLGSLYNSFSVGAHQFGGDIAEVIVYNKTLLPIEREDVENYLFERYYYQYFSGHGTDIGGLNYSAAGTAQTEIVSSILTINNDDFADGDYLFVGHDNATLSPLSSSTGDLPSGNNMRVERVWRADVTGDGGTVTIEVDISSFESELASGETFRLLVDTDDGDFSDSYQYSGTIASSVLTVSNVELDGDYYLTVGKVSASANQTYYSYQNGNWDDDATWTNDPSGNTQIPVGGTAPVDGATVIILNGTTVTIPSTDAAKEPASLEIKNGATLDLTTNTASHNFGTVSGTGTLKLSSLTFPNGAFSTFMSSSGGTVEYYDVSTGTLPTGTTTYNNLIISNSTASAYTYTLDSNLTTNGDFTLTNSGAGSITFTIGNSTTVRTVTFNEDVAISSNSELNVSTDNATHNVYFYGSLANNGTLDFQNGLGKANAEFTGSSNETVMANSSTLFYNLILNKGTDQTYMLTISSSDVSYFSMTATSAVMQIKSGTLKLESNIEITTLGTGNYDVSYDQDTDGALWIDGATLDINSNAIVVYGSFRLTSGVVTVGKQGIVNREDGEILIEGGTLNVSKYRLSATSTSHRGSFTMTGGTMNIDESLGSSSDGHAAFSIPFEDQSYTMSGGIINVKYAESTGTAIDGGWQVNTNTYSVTGGTVNIYIPNSSTNFGIASTAPFWNLNIERNGASGSGVAIIKDIGNQYGTVSAQDLVVKNNFTLSATNSPTFDANGFDVTVNNDFVINTNATYTNNGSSNTTTFNRNGSQVITLNEAVTFDNLTITTVNHATFDGTDNPTIDGDLTIENGILENGGLNFNVGGNLTINSAEFNGSGAIVLNSSTGSQSINGDDDAIITYLTLNNTSGASGDAVVTLNTDLIINNTLTLTSDRKFNISSKNLAFISSASISGTPTSTRFIQTSGNVTDKGLTKSFSASGGSFTFPIGIGTNYTPATLNVTDADGSAGTITVRPVSQEHPQTSASNVALLYYWRTTSTGFGATPELTHTYNYTSSITANGTTSNYIYGRFDISNSEWSSGATADVDESSYIIGGTSTGLENVAFIDGDYTAGELIAFGTVTVYYSRANGDWNTASTWSNTSHTGSAASTPPTSSDIVIIGDGSSNNHTVTVNDVESAVSNTLKLSSGSTLDLQASTGNNFGVIQAGGGTGYGTLRLRSATFPTGDFSEFLTNNGGTVEYYRDGSNFTLPSSVDTYYNLELSTDGGATGTLTLPATDLVILGNFYVGLSGNDASLVVESDAAAARTLTVKGDLDITAVDASNTTTFTLMSGGDHALSIDGDITVGSNGEFKVENAGSNTMTLTAKGNITNSGSIDFYTGSSVVDITLSNTETQSITGVGSTFDLNGFTVNKGTSSSATATVNSSNFTLNGDLTLSNGTLILTSSSTITLANNAAFNIPSTAELRMNGATAQITGTGYMTLSGTLRMESGTMNVGTTNQNNYIQYASAGTPAIIVNGGTLTVASQIRRSTLTSNGDLSYTQTGGTVTVGNQQAPTKARGVFEVLNSGDFTMSNGTLVIASSQSSATDATIAAFYLQPGTSSITNGTIQIGNSNTPSSTTIRINSSETLYNLKINSANSPTAKLVIQPLLLANNLDIESGATFNSNSLDLTIAGNMTTTGTFTSGTNTTTFTGSSAQITGNTTFSSLTYSSTGTLSLQSSTGLTVNGTLNQSSGSGTISLGSNDLDVNGDATINGTISGTGKLIFSGSSAQTFYGDNTVNVSNLKISNASGVTLESDLEISSVLTLNSGNLFIGNYLLDLTNTSVSAVEDGSSGTNFSNTNMIKSSGSTSSSGVRKSFPASTADFTFPIGVTSKYTPARFNISANSATGTITVKPINTTISSATDDNADGNDLLSYYWDVVGSGFSGLTLKHEYTYNETDVQTAGSSSSDGDYDAGRFNSSSWTYGIASLGSLNTTTNVITIDGGTGASNAGVSYTDGNFTAGLGSDEFGTVATFTSTTTGNWETDGTWDQTGAPAGNVVVVAIGDVVTITSNSRSAVSLEIKGTLDIGSTNGHNFGTVTGTGTLIIGSNKFPGGDFSAFTSAGNGTIEYDFTGTLPTQAIYNDLKINSGGTSTLANLDITVNGDVILTSGTLNNSSYNRTIYVLGDWINNDASNSFNAGTGSVVFNSSSAVQAIGGTASTTFYDVEIDNSSGSNVSLATNITISNDLTLSDGTLALGSNTLTVNGDITNNKSSTALNGGTGTVLLNGSSVQTIGGTQATTFYNLTLNNSHNTGVNLGRSITVDNTLTFTDGNLNTTGSYGVTLNSTTGNLSGESSSNYLVGIVSITKNVGTGASTFGNIGVSIAAGSSNLSNVTIKRVSGSNGIVTVDGKQGIARYWVITNTGSNPFTARNITYSWIANDDNGKDLSKFRIFKRPNEGSGAFEGVDDYQDITTGSDTRSITVSQNSFSQVSGSDQNNALPVELIDVSLLPNNQVKNHLKLTWITATEKENYGFFIERSFIDKNENNISNPELSFEELGFVQGNGTTTIQQTYTFTDKTLNTSGMYHYQIRQIDFDGSERIYGPYEYAFEVPLKNELNSVYPNPFNPTTTINYILAKDSRISIEVYDILGRRVKTLIDETKKAGIYDYTFNASDLASGLYYIRMITDGKMYIKKVVLIK